MGVVIVFLTFIYFLYEVESDIKWTNLPSFDFRSLH